MISDEELKRLDELAEAGSPAPWTFFGAAGDCLAVRAGGRRIYGRMHEQDCEVDAQDVADWTLAAEARNAVPALCAEVRRLRAALTQISDACIRHGTSDRTDADDSFRIATMALEQGGGAWVPDNEALIKELRGSREECDRLRQELARIAGLTVVEGSHADCGNVALHAIKVARKALEGS